MPAVPRFFVHRVPESPPDSPLDWTVMKPTTNPATPTNPADAGLSRIVLSPVQTRPLSESPLSINALVPQSQDHRLPTFGMLNPVPERQPPLVEPSTPAWSPSRLEGPDSDHKLVKAFAAEAAARHLCSDKTLSHGGASADVRRRINYAFNALCKVSGAGAVVSESSFLDVTMEDAAIIRRFRRAAQSTPGNNPKTLANLAVTLKHLSKWLAQRGEMDLEGLQHNPDEAVADAVIIGFRRDPAVQGAAKSRVGAAVKLLREAAGGSVVLPKRPRRATFAQPVVVEAGVPQVEQDA